MGALGAGGFKGNSGGGGGEARARFFVGGAGGGAIIIGADGAGSINSIGCAGAGVAATNTTAWPTIARLFELLLERETGCLESRL